MGLPQNLWVKSESCVKNDLPIQFVDQDITSYSGLELFRRYFCLIKLHGKIRHACPKVGLRSEYGCVNRVLVVVAMLLVGARRLEQLKYLNQDPLVLRLCPQPPRARKVAAEKMLCPSE